MRILTTLSAALAVAVLPWPAAAGTTTDPSLHIHRAASQIYQYDSSDFGEGPVYPATGVTVTLARCPAGEYQLTASLVQDGVQAGWATGSALGASEVFCDGSARQTINRGFYSDTLHPGKAFAKWALYGFECADGICTMSDTPTMQGSRMVRIPRAHHRCHERRR